VSYRGDPARGCGCMIVVGSAIIAVAGMALVVWAILHRSW
jgi:hypothetical protein